MPDADSVGLCSDEGGADEEPRAGLQGSQNLLLELLKSPSGPCVSPDEFPVGRVRVPFGLDSLAFSTVRWTLPSAVAGVAG